MGSILALSSAAAMVSMVNTGLTWRLGIDAASGSSSSRSNGSGDGAFNVLTKIEWAKGKLSSTQLQRFAEAALRQGMPDVDHLAKVGSHGKHAGNLHRDLVRLFGLPQEAPEIRWLEIPTIRGPKTPHPFLLPIEFLQKLFVHSQSGHWQAIMGGNDGAAERHWRAWSHTDFVRLHPHIAMERWPFIIPIGLHGDGGAFSKQETVNVLSWNSLLGSGSTLQTRFLFTLIQKSDVVPATMEAILRIFGEQMNELAVAHVNHLIGSYSAVLSQVRGDWAFYCEVFHFPQWNSALRMCWLCEASSTIDDKLWCNCKDDAGWRDTRFTHESYLAYCAAHGLTVAILLVLCVGFRLECITIDSLHAVDIGFWCHIVGNTFWHLAVRRRVFGGSTQAIAIQRLWQHLYAWYKRTNCEYRLQSKLTESNLRSESGFPKLKAKAAQARKLAPYLLSLAEEFFTEADDEQLMLVIIRCMVRYYDILKTAPDYLDPNHIAEMRTIGRSVGRAYELLAAIYKERNVRMFKMMPKVHLFQHLTEYMIGYWRTNPRTFWTYQDEDLVGAVLSAAHATHPKTMCLILLYKWLLQNFDEDVLNSTQ